MTNSPQAMSQATGVSNAKKTQTTGISAIRTIVSMFGKLRISFFIGITCTHFRASALDSATLPPTD